MFLHRMMGAGSEVRSGQGVEGVELGPCWGARGTGRSATLSSRGKAREGKKTVRAAPGEPLLVGWLSVLGIKPALS